MGADHSRDDRERRSIGVAAVVVLALGAAAVFAAGINVGSQIQGRDAGEQAALEAFSQTYRRITDDYVGDADPGALLGGAIEGMFEAIDDPYSAYMGPDEYDSALSAIGGEFEGIGARMTAEDGLGDFCEPIGDGCQLRVVEVLPGSPALEAGLLADDVVRAIDDLTLDGQTVDDAVVLIRGPRDTEVVLTVERGDVEQELAIVRDVILTQDVRSATLADGSVGYLRIDGFRGRAAEDLEGALREQLDAGIERFVLDVRDDPGGFVDEVVTITSQFIDDGAVFWEEDARGTQRAVEAEGGGLATDPAIELVVLIDGGSASASEILAAALQDAGRAQLVGTRTFGKGTIQEWTQLPGTSGGFRLSVAKWLTRDKRWVDGDGLTPDVLVEGDDRVRPGDPESRGADPQLARALDVLLGAEVPAALVTDADAGAASASSAPLATAGSDAKPVATSTPGASWPGAS